jgi:hypothetical protein
LTLPREGSIKGRVQDEQGQPVGGVELVVRSGRPDGDITNLYSVRTTRSDPTGSFAFEGIPEGPHEIEVLPAEQGPDLWVAKATKVSVASHQVVETTVRVGKGGILEVTALDSLTRRPLAGAKASCRGLGWLRRGTAIADAAGVIRMRAPAGSYEVAVWIDRCACWKSTEEVADGQTLKYDATVTPWTRVSGRAVDPDGQPVPAALVVLHGGDHVVADRSGRFTAAFDEVRQGRGGYLAARDPGRGLATVTPIGNRADPIELRLRPAWRLVGKVTDPNGAGVPAARVGLDWDVGGIDRLDVLVLTDSEGRFTMDAIPSVQKGFSYRLSVNASGFGPYRHRRISPEGPAGATVDIGVITVPPATASISGVVVDANGAPAPGARVHLFEGGRGEIEQPRKAAVTDEQGRFGITRLCRGPIDLQVGWDKVPAQNAKMQVQIPCDPLRVVLGRNAVKEPEVSIKGKALPGLAELSKDLTQIQGEGKPLLVCLVDVEQRPSRQCLSDLAKKTGVLSSKGVTPVVIQVSKADLGRYQDWIKANQIAFTIHSTEGDFESRKAQWGVRAVPWLILTDKDRKVVAEGFAASELDRVVGR